ncbi:MAG: MarR family transcriptional regulator [Deltaproteobacteria bacterium]|jgi:MarR family transcriptional regulator, organic hydroperoxide resistance regulator|nr:MarR family transcriptional regulator [Deltaproteobacteria bacterium]MBT4266125.1 MarR family transcriptional regulator [Deltaproteobacteria bacterium]MBT4639612.1 MarR family transcriptional regulator [Deltaproteobacteria bacterium]MBT6504906.1 MarR family transcriptional regulator [Deltaproteobacteria bacterium]MBT7153352.1 MarR family transcriptional regulator [Deltaproteobacteria bacterium]
MEHKQLFFLVQRAQHCLNKLGDKAFQKVLGVSSAHLSALFYLMRHNDCLLKDLSAGLDLNNSAVTGLVRRMEAVDLIIKRSCEQDGRAFRVKLTEKGLTVAKEANPVLQKIHKLLSSDFTIGEMDTIIRFLATIIAVKEVEEVSILESI